MPYAKVGSNIRKALTERVVYRQHSERVTKGESHLCEVFTKTNPELLCGRNGKGVPGPVIGPE